jgi:hypothetical protein
VVNPTITSVTLTAADVISLAANNWAIRVGIDAANNAAAALLLPTTFPTGSPTKISGQVFIFNIKPVFMPDTEAAGDLRLVHVVMDAPVRIPVSSSGITRLDFAHNIGANMTLNFGVSAVELI